MNRRRIERLIALVQLRADEPAERLIKVLVADEGAVERFNAGTHELRCAGVVGTCTSGSPEALLDSWTRAAQRKVDRLP